MNKGRTWICATAGIVVLFLVVAIWPDADPSTSRPDDGRRPFEPPQQREQAALATPPHQEAPRQSPAQPIDVPAVSPGDSSEPWRPPSERALWEQLYVSVDSLFVGTLEPDAMVRLAAGLLSRIGEVEPRLEADNGFVAYRLLDDPAFGTAILLHRVGDDPRGLSNEFVIQADVRTAPGAHTGLPEDEARNASIEMGFSFDDDDRPIHYTTVAQVSYHQGASLRSLLEAQGRTLPIGGTLSVRPNGAIWHQVTVEPTDVGGEPAWHSRVQDPFSVDGSLVSCGLTELVAEQLLATRQRQANGAPQR